LLALEILEIRELLSTYDLKGDSVLVSYDAQTPEPGAAIAAYGVRETLRTLSRFAPLRVQSGDIGSANEIWGAVYLLTESEVDGHAVSLTPQDSVLVWSEGTQSRATLSSVTPYFPGDFREMPLSMDVPVKGREGSRILLVRGDRVVGLGTITQIGR
jgi:translation elongation factor EF-Tu-like GTPase